MRGERVKCIINLVILDVSRTIIVIFFFQAEDGIRDYKVTGVQTCALPIFGRRVAGHAGDAAAEHRAMGFAARPYPLAVPEAGEHGRVDWGGVRSVSARGAGIGRASGRGRGEISVGGGSLKKKKVKRGVSKC